MAGLTMDELSQIAARRDRQRHTVKNIFAIGLRLTALTTFLLAFAMLFTIIVKGFPAINAEFLTTGPRENMSAGGIRPMIRGSLLIMAGALLSAIPLGILGGMFLAEFSDRYRTVKFVRSCVSALAGTPSIVFGLFGMTLFIILPRIQPNLVAGCLTVAIMALPIVVQSTEQAIRSVPESVVEAAEAIGLTRAQGLFKVILPAAIPGIATGLILAIGRAAGEAPPIFLTAGIYYSTGGFQWGLDMLKKPVENLPYHLAEGYRQGGSIPDKIIWGTCLVLMAMILCINLISILIRNRSRKNLSQ